MFVTIQNNDLTLPLWSHPLTRIAMTLLLFFLQTDSAQILKTNFDTFSHFFLAFHKILLNCDKLLEKCFQSVAISLGDIILLLPDLYISLRDNTSFTLQTQTHYCAPRFRHNSDTDTLLSSLICTSASETTLAHGFHQPPTPFPPQF